MFKFQSLLITHIRKKKAKMQNENVVVAVRVRSFISFFKKFILLFKYFAFFSCLL